VSTSAVAEPCLEPAPVPRCGRRSRRRAWHADHETLIVDTHAHAFRPGLPLATDARYAPNHDATVSQSVAQLDASGVAAGVLMQPSFLGSDNTYLLAAWTEARP